MLSFIPVSHIDFSCIPLVTLRAEFGQELLVLLFCPQYLCISCGDVLTKYQIADHLPPWQSAWITKAKFDVVDFSTTNLRANVERLSEETSRGQVWLSRCCYNRSGQYGCLLAGWVACLQWSA